MGVSMRLIGPVSLALAIALSASASVPASARSGSTGLNDLVGARAGQAEAELQRRGYRNVRGEKGDDRSYAYWWSEDRNQCVSIVTANGRYESITPTTAPDCRISQYDRGRSDRYSGDVRHSRHHMPARGISDVTELQSICRAEASGRFDRRPSDLTVNAPISQRNGAIVQGWFNEGRRSKFFTCRFDEDGRFINVL